MDADLITAIVSGLFGLCGTGGFLYLLFDKKVASRGEKADAAHTEADTEHTKETNNQEAVETGMKSIAFYKEIDELIRQHTDPLNEKIDQLNYKLNRWCCYRDVCSFRLRDEKEAEESKEVTQEEIEASIKKNMPEEFPMEEKVDEEVEEMKPEE